MCFQLAALFIVFGLGSWGLMLSRVSTSGPTASQEGAPSSLWSASSYSVVQSGAELAGIQAELQASRAREADLVAKVETHFPNRAVQHHDA